MEQIERRQAVARELGDYDVLIFGGGLSGWATAVKLARSSHSVLLAASHTSLGHEVAAAMSVWWPGELELPDLWAEIVDELSGVNAAHETMVDPVATQVALERRAEEAGVELLLQVNAHPEAADRTLLTGRWGLMAARSAVTVDAGNRGDIAVEAGAQIHARITDEPVIRRALMVKTGITEPERIEIGEDLPLVDGAVMAWKGYWPGDVILEANLDLLPPDADDPAAICREVAELEMRSRQAMAEIVTRLRRTREEFAQGSLVSVAHDPVLPRSRVLVASQGDTPSATLRDDGIEVTVTRGMMLPKGTENVIVASPAVDSGGMTARASYYPPNAVALGEAAALLAEEML